MPSPTREDILAALARVADPESGNPVSAGRISGVTVKDGKAGFLITVPPSMRDNGERLRAACEKAAASIPGIRAVTAVLTAHQDAPSTPERGRAVWNRQPVEGVKRIIAVASGKGGVGKSTTSVNLALALAEAGARVGLLDADIYGPSIPRMLGLLVQGQPELKDDKMLPPRGNGIPCMSIGFVIPDKAAILRGPMITKALSQLLRATHWDDLDILLIDMPPGTGDIHLSLAQQTPIDGAVIVTTPQAVAVEDARKCAETFRKLDVLLLGVVENMSWFTDPAGNRHALFGAGGGQALAAEFGMKLLAQVPMEQGLREAADAGQNALTLPAQGEAASAYRALAQALLRMER